MFLVDSHAHLDDEQFAGDQDAVVARAKAVGVGQVITIGTTADSSERCVGLASRHPEVFAAVGIQPNYVAEAREGDWERIVELSRQPRVVAIGETGLDHYWDFAPLDRQRPSFESHIRLSQATGLPIVVHMREPKEAGEGSPCCAQILNCLERLQGEGAIRGVMHSYTGTSEYVARFVELGMFISFAGMVTFKNSADLRAVALGVPLDRLLIETDSPYLSPHPVRGKRPNEPQYLTNTAACLAEVRGLSVDELARITTANARSLFRLPAEADAN